MYEDPDELQSFLSEMGDVKPLKNDKAELRDAQMSIREKLKRGIVEDKTESLNPLSMEGVVPIDPEDYLTYQQPGIQDGVFKNLRLGKYPIEHKISVAAMPLEESRETLFRSLLKCHEKGMRAVVINHGKGANSKPFPGLKKSYVKHWLDELDLVIAYHTAQPHHGGTGATYVLLKKHPQQKQIYRELNRKR